MTDTVPVFSALISILDLGGPVVGILLLLSVGTLALILIKYWQFHTAGVGDDARLTRALVDWSAGYTDDATDKLATSRSIAGKLAWEAMELSRLARTGDLPAIEDRITAEALVAVARLRRGFRALEAVAQLAPLIGLFGTVLGMIEAFQALQQAGTSVDPSLLAGGIWVALLTTAVGLAVAIPTSLALTHLESRVARDVTAIDYAVSTVLSTLALSTLDGSTASQGRPNVGQSMAGMHGA
ncbi:MAG: MotA/TolQ/ExbB proton channel family protein [Pseudomonadota bacterium]